MELKPENEEKEVKYPSGENVDKEKLKKPLKKWQKVGITAAVVTGVVAICGAVGYYNATQDEDPIDGAVAYTPGPDLINDQFISYIGDRVRGGVIKTLLSKINAFNATNGELHIHIHITVNNSNEIKIGDIKSNKFYKVEEEYDADGYINNINITEVVEEKIEEPQNVENMESE